MNAEPKGSDYLSVLYEKMFDNRPSIWYYGDGNWFEVVNENANIYEIYLDKISFKKTKTLSESKDYRLC